MVRNGTVGTLSPAIDTNFNVDRFCAVPTAIEPKLNLSGFFLAASITSRTVLSGLSLCTNSTKSNVAIGPTGVKSRDQSYGSALNIDGAMAFWLLTQSIEWPSGAARATASAAVAPPAPGMFSITTGWPIDCDITCADGAAGDVAEAARAEAHDDLHGPRRKLLRRRRRRSAPSRSAQPQAKRDTPSITSSSRLRAAVSA